jgi:transposase InsO family protein
MRFSEASAEVGRRTCAACKRVYLSQVPQSPELDSGTNFMSELFQQMFKLLQIKRITSTAFNLKMQGKIETFHLGLNQIISHYCQQIWEQFGRLCTNGA